ncbi:MAG: hypothetical protein GYA17_17125 [Chloroflexi bacterium]|nr:hypothetical protein [Chloroflexota bacterium]
MHSDNSFDQLEHDLEALYTLAEPEAGFVASLGRRWISRPGRIRPLRRRLAAIAAAVLLLALVTILAIGPQRVWAMTLSWLSGGTGFSSQVGFAPLGATLELDHPVEARRGAAIVTIEEALLMQGKDTRLDYSIRLSPEIYAALAQEPDLPPGEEESLQESMPVYRYQAFQNWIRIPGGARQSTTTGGMVYLQDGQLVSRQSYSMPGETLYKQYELVLPGALAEMIGAGPGDWSIPFDLKAVEMIAPQPTQDPSTQATGATPAPSPTPQAGGAVYQPEVAEAIQGFDIQLSDVAITTQETAIRLAIHSQNPNPQGFNSQTASLDAERIHLQDEMGHIYAPIENDAHSDDAFQRTLYFEPLQPGAKHLTLTVDSVDVITTALLPCPPGNTDCVHPALEYSLQNGEELRPGVVLTPAQELELPGFPGYTLTLEQAEIAQPDPIPGVTLALHVLWRYQLPPALELVGVPANAMLSSGEPMASYGGVSHSGVPSGEQRIQETYLLTGELPSPLLAVYLDVGAWEVEWSGPWVLEWDVPGT